MNWYKRAMLASEKYLLNKGYTNIHLDYEDCFIAAVDENGDNIVARVRLHSTYEKYEQLTASNFGEFERAAADFASCGILKPNTHIRFDDIQYRIDFDKGQGILRHHENCTCGISPNHVPSMTLGKLFSLLDEFCNVVILDDETGAQWADYDGRNSIPEEYNGCEVTHITHTSECLRVYIILPWERS